MLAALGTALMVAAGMGVVFALALLIALTMDDE